MKKFNAINSASQPDGNFTQFKPLAVRIPEAVRMTGIGRTKLYALMASGDVTTVKIGRSTLIPVASLEALLSNNKQQRPHKNH